jgi:hypothetical protein
MRSYQYTPQELTRILLKAAGITEGHWELGLAYDIRPMRIGDENNKSQAPLPSLVFRLAQVALVEAPAASPAAVDASQIVDD